MINFNAFQFFNKEKEHILDVEMIGDVLNLTVYANGEEENYFITLEETLELTNALDNLISQVDPTTRQ